MLPGDTPPVPVPAKRLTRLVGSDTNETEAGDAPVPVVAVPPHAVNADAVRAAASTGAPAFMARRKNGPTFPTVPVTRQVAAFCSTTAGTYPPYSTPSLTTTLRRIPHSARTSLRSKPADHSPISQGRGEPWIRAPVPDVGAGRDEAAEPGEHRDVGREVRAVQAVDQLGLVEAFLSQAAEGRRVGRRERLEGVIRGVVSGR